MCISSCEHYMRTATFHIIYVFINLFLGVGFVCLYHYELTVFHNFLHVQVNKVLYQHQSMCFPSL